MTRRVSRQLICCLMVLGLTRCGPQPLEVSDAGLVSADAGQRDDAGSPDASMSDAGVVDAGLTDAGLPDAGPVDAGISDAAVADAGASDSGATDAGAIDAGSDAGPTDAGSRDAGTRHRGVYLYDADNVVLDLTARANALSWLRTNGYTDVYLSSERYFGNGSLPQLAAFIQDAKVTYGLDTSLLFSNYEWTLDVNHAAARTQIQTALTWVQSLPPSQVRPVAFQLDVEPHALAGWVVSNPATIQDLGSQYLRLLDTLRPIMSGMPLQMVIAYHYDTKLVARTTDAGVVTRPFSEWIIDGCDSTLMMNYRDVGTRLESGARDEVTYATLVHKQVTVAVKVKQNTTPLPDGGVLIDADQTDNFSDEGAAAMQSALTTMETTPTHRDGTTGVTSPAVPLDTLSGYGGFSVFAYRYLRQLPP